MTVRGASNAALALLLAAGCGGPVSPPGHVENKNAPPDESGRLATWHYPGPACRRDDALAKEVQSAGARILDALRRARDPVKLEGGGAVAFDRVAVNDGGVEAGVLHIELVKDAEQGAVDAAGCPRGAAPSTSAGDRDALTVDALCEALPVRGVGVIRCSADGLAALSAEDRRRGRQSPALTYVLAHELSHLIHGDGRSFLPAALAIDLALPEPAKWDLVSRGCDPRSQRTAATLEYERRADRDAVKILEDVVLADAVRNPTEDASVSVALASMAVWVAAESVKHWARRWEHGAMLPAALVDAPLAPNDAYVRWSVDRVLCDLLTKTQGHVLVPSFNGTHPSEPERLALISVELARLAPKFHAAPGPLPPQVQELTARLTSINAIIDVQQRAYFEAFGASLCGRTARGQRPACAQVSAVGPVTRPSCPQFTARYTEHDLTLEATSLSIRGAGGDTVVDADVHAALALQDGRLFIGAVFPNVAAITGSGGTTAWKLPCEPAAALEETAGIAVLCERPFGLLTLNDAGRARFREASTIEFDGDPAPTNAVRGGWIGSVDGVVHATMHLPVAGKSTTIRFDDDGARSARPWRSEGCERLVGMSAFRFDPGGPVFGAAWSPKAASLVARFDASFERISGYAHPMGEPHVLACGAASMLKKLVCADASGVVFDPLASSGRTPLLRFSPSPVLAKSPRMRGRICSTEGGLYVQTAGDGGAATINEVFFARNGQSTFQRVFSDTSPEPEIVCGKRGATVVVGAPGNARIVRF